MSLAVREAVGRVTPAPVTPPSWRRSLAVVVRSGLASQRRALLTWGGGLGAMCALIAGMWPSIEGSIEKMMENYPSALKEAFGIQELNSVEKYVDAEMLSLIVPLALAFFAVRCATRVIVGWEERGHLDALLSLPLSRRVLVVGSYIVTAVMVAGILAVEWAMTWITGIAAGTGMSAATMAAGFANVWPLAMAFAGLAVLAAGFLHRPATVTAIATGTLVAMYVIDLVGKLASALEPLRTVSAFRYYGSAVQNGIEVPHVLGLTAVGIAMAAIGAVLFDRRDVL
jgi:ABC-2 type transport system permease protein